MKIQQLTLITIIFSIGVSQQVWAVEYECVDYTYQYNCSNHGGYKCKDLTSVSDPADCYPDHGGPHVPMCGNGIVEGSESCDEGSYNSDLKEDGCRTDCTRAHCGDHVADSGEECDGDDHHGAICSDFKVKGSQQVLDNNDRYWPGYGSLSCDYDCMLDLSECGYCGDGITQSPHEQCDDNNSNNDDGCNNNCTSCLQLTDNVDIITDTELCTHNFNLTDYGDEGVIIIKHPDITLDCDGASLVGQGVGVGIYVKMSNNVTIKNCNVSGFAVGIKIVNSQGTHFSGEGNVITGNGEKLVLENSTLAPPKPMTKVTEGILKNTPPPEQKLTSKLQNTSQAETTARDVVKPINLNQIKKPSKPGQNGRSGDKAEPQGSSIAKSQDNRAVLGAPLAPVIIYPRPNQVFQAPASFIAKVKFNNPQNITFGIKRRGQRNAIAKSRNGVFANIAPGFYCVYATNSQNSKLSSKCVAFSVVAGKPLKSPSKTTSPDKTTIRNIAPPSNRQSTVNQK